MLLIMSSSVVTIEEFEAAVIALLGERLGEKEAKEIARRAMNYFGFDDSVVDNTISPKDRDMFYILEEVGLITTFEDETFVEKGKRWRIHYWVLNKDKISKAPAEDNSGENGSNSVYNNWNEDWTRKG